MQKYKLNTKNRIIWVANRVFANLSFQKTTMDDIARESKLGRRTLYTYFKTKDDLYKAVINHWNERIIERLGNIVNLENNTAEEKFKFFVHQRMMEHRFIINKNKALRKEFSSNPSKLEKLRINLDNEEKNLLVKLIEQGIEDGVFKNQNPKELVEVLIMNFRGFEIYFTKNNYNKECILHLKTYIKCILNGMLKK